MMDSRGHVHVLEETAPTQPLRHTGFTTRDPMPEACNPRKVLSALEKLAERAPGDIHEHDAALIPLTPFERGYVRGVLAEYRAWKERQR